MIGNDKILKWENELRERLTKEGADLDGKILMFRRGHTYFNGEEISGFCESKDESFICIPVLDEGKSSFLGEYVYKPQCFEIAEKYQTYLSNGSITTLTDIWLLYETLFKQRILG